MTELMPAEGVFSLIWLLIALPLAGAVVLLFGGRRTNTWGPILGVLTVSASAVLGWIMLLAMLQNSAEERTFDQNLFSWVFAGSFQADMAFQLDQLSMVFVLLITTVGALIHVYSLGYMSHDRDKRKFFGYLNLFVGAMLILVLANNYLLLYVGWEGVGLASYLLIGFWQVKPSAAAAAKKAFIINRVGDVGLSLAIMLMFVTFGTVSFEGVFGVADQASEGTLNAIGLLLLLAACGKSAQFPLQAWLLDAMEGPTPVSALIHAATMVTAGVYLIARSNAIFDIAEIAATAVVVVGLITVFMGAIIGSAKDDIKKSLAGSTMSQIGYMITAVGLGPIGYVFAIFHLLTHGVFKAGLFLGAGSVMHGMNDNVNMRRYGAVRTVMFITFITFAAGWLAILGIPPFSGFWSKDELIHAAFEQSMITGWLLIIAAGITGLLHDPHVHHDLPGQGPLGGRRAPARVAQGHDHPVDHPGPRVGLPRHGASLLGQHRVLARARGRVREGRVAAAHVGDDRPQPAGRRHRRAGRVPHVPAPPGPGRGAARLVAHAGCP